MPPPRKSLFAFVDRKDPFAQSELAEEPLSGPVLSILAARPFTDVFLFHTPHTRQNAEATAEEIRKRHPECAANLFELPVSDPKDYSSVMGALGRQVRRIVPGLKDSDLSVCVSSGTAEMRAAWFLLGAANVLPGRFLQVGSPAEPLFGAAAVKEVSLDSGDWSALRDLLMPLTYFNRADEVRAKIRPRFDDASVFQAAMSVPPPPRPLVAAAAPPEPEPEPNPQLEAALRELNFHILSPHMRFVAERASIVAAYAEAALIEGETGTGKELVARLVHRLSSRSRRKMVTVNCGAIPQELAEAYLFGHVKGAFTGAIADRPGIFEAANGSTLFLDEIGELAPACQPKLLRALQFGEFERVGSTHTIRVDVRVIAATHRHLADEVSQGGFRSDLYQRLNILKLDIPPLRERPGEIAPLALAILKDINAQRQQPRQLSKEALARLETDHWPGNVRELDATLRRSVAFASRAVLAPEDILIDHQQPPDPFRSLPEPGPDFKLEDFLDRVRSHLMLRALEKTGGNQAAAAELLGISKQAVNQFLGKRR